MFTLQGDPPPHAVSEATAESRKEPQQVGSIARVCHAHESPGRFALTVRLETSGLALRSMAAEDCVLWKGGDEIFGYVIFFGKARVLALGGRQQLGGHWRVGEIERVGNPDQIVIK